MRKNVNSICTILIACAFFFVCSACGSQMERDASKLAKRAVEMEQVQQRFGDRSNLQGKPMSREELNAYIEEYTEYTNQMLEKYSQTPEMSAEFIQLVDAKKQQLR